MCCVLKHFAKFALTTIKAYLDSIIVYPANKKKKKALWCAIAEVQRLQKGDFLLCHVVGVSVGVYGGYAFGLSCI